MIPVSKRSTNLDELDARELHRRELAWNYIDDLPEEAREVAEVEENEKIVTYEQYRADYLVHGEINQRLTLRCQQPGCTAAPFQTQSLLK